MHGKVERVVMRRKDGTNVANRSEAGGQADKYDISNSSRTVEKIKDRKRLPASQPTRQATSERMVLNW
jgi:hypothetical protein